MGLRGSAPIEGPGGLRPKMVLSYFECDLDTSPGMSRQINVFTVRVNKSIT